MYSLAAGSCGFWFWARLRDRFPVFGLSTEHTWPRDSSVSSVLENRGWDLSATAWIYFRAFIYPHERMLFLFVSKTWIKGYYFSGQAHGRPCSHHFWRWLSSNCFLELGNMVNLGHLDPVIGTQKGIGRRDSDWCEHEKRTCWYRLNKIHCVY